MTRILSTRRALLFLVLVCAGQSASADISGLIDLLTNNLGVSTEQATGGAGAIFDYAKQRLSPDQFSQVSSVLPGVDSLIGAAPKPAPLGDKLVGLSSALGGDSGTARAIGSLGGSFSQLGLSPDMVGEFIPVVLDYAKSQGGPEIMKLLQGALL